MVNKTKILLYHERDKRGVSNPREPFLPQHWQKGHMAMMVAISTAKCMLASRIPCCTFQSSCWYPGSSCLAPSPPPPLASHFSYNPAIFFYAFFPGPLSHSPPLSSHGQVSYAVLVQPTPLSPCSGLTQMPLHLYNENLPLHCTLGLSYPQIIQGERFQQLLNS